MVLDLDCVLTKVTRYRLQRPDGTVRIDLHEVILGSDAKFVAIPVDALGVATPKQELHVPGEESFLALEALVEKLNGLPHAEIYPKSV